MTRSSFRFSWLASLPRTHLVIIAVLMVAQVACAAFGLASSSDTSRDIFFAQQIASGQSFPLTGPGINGMLHLGPLWFYLLAIPLLVVKNAAAVTGTMGLLSATQFPLAYLLGTRLRSRHEGLLFALCLALPGWVVTSFGSLTHPITAIPSVLLATLATLAYAARPNIARASGLGAALALMCMAHPTLVLFALLMLAWCAWRVAAPMRLLGHGALIVLIVLLPLLPMLYEQWLNGFSDITSARAYAQSEWSIPSPLKALELLHAMVVHGPRYVTRFWLELPDAASIALLAVYALLLLFAAIGLLAIARTDAAGRSMLSALLGVLLLHAVFLCAVRDAMPPWMVYILGALIAALIALGLGWWWPRRPWRIVIAVLLGVTTLWTFAIYAKLTVPTTEFKNIRASPGKRGFMDVRDYEDGMDTVFFARAPFRELFALGDLLCVPTSLYGHLAYQVDFTYAVSAAQVCGTTRHVQFGGLQQPGRESLMGLHRDAWRAIGMTPERSDTTIGVSRPDAVWHSTTPLAPVVPTFNNFPRGLAPTDAPFRVRGQAPGDRAVLVANRANRYAPFATLRARANGQQVEARYRDLTVAVFTAPPAPGDLPVEWEIEIQGNSDYIDVLTFTTAASADAAAN